MRPTHFEFPGSRPARWRLGLAAALWLLAAACSSRDTETGRGAPEPEEQSREDAGAADPDASVLEQLRGLGYTMGGGGGGPVGEPSRAAVPPGHKDPDTGALSELDKRHAQNRGQRAHEAFDYLGPRVPAAEPAPVSQEPGGFALADDERKRLSVTYQAQGVARDGPGALSSLSPAQRFLRERSSLEDLHFQPGSGYWANTYVPGDPVLRWLESRLAEQDRAALQQFAAHPLVLEAAARPTRQPFDPPGSAALAVFVEADRRGLEREERMLVQVGVRGAERRSGLRPAMSVGIVLDARGALDAGAAASMRALLEAFLAAKDVGDRFGLRVAGRPGGPRVSPEQFRHGPLSLALRQLLEPGPAPRGETLDLVEALTRTSAELQRGDDPAAPLGSSLVLLVTSQPLAPHTEALVEAAHASAVAGVPVSVVAVGETSDAEPIERVTLAGQGQRRMLREPGEAEAIVDLELSALARVVARALRLNIRLAAGVRLVEVVGAERLDAAGADRVRRAERSIDQRLARRLGIERDRGEDQDGIQIVIPAFMSGDSHAVLLDVVASGPGPIADVTVRYKDLVHLRNGVARANLSLGRSAEAAGPLQRNVVKNYLAARLAGELKRAGRSLLEGGDAEAVAAVRELGELLASLRHEVPGFQNDAELAADDAMLDEYLALLQPGVLDLDEPRRYLADSLQLSGYLKTVPRSMPLGTARR